MVGWVEADVAREISDIVHPARRVAVAVTWTAVGDVPRWGGCLIGVGPAPGSDLTRLRIASVDRRSDGRDLPIIRETTEANCPATNYGFRASDSPVPSAPPRTHARRHDDDGVRGGIACVWSAAPRGRGENCGTNGPAQKTDPLPVPAARASSFRGKKMVDQCVGRFTVSALLLVPTLPCGLASTYRHRPLYGSALCSFSYFRAQFFFFLRQCPSAVVSCCP
jgi:hypothetical protein